MDNFIGEIMLVPYNFAPRGWAFCAGQILPISQNTALFSLIGTTYGGNGQTTFALPNLQGRAALGQGQGPGLSRYDLGEQDGVESVTLVASQLPVHTHSLRVATDPASGIAPNGAYPAPTTGGVGNEYGTVQAAPMAPNAVGPTGGDQPHTNMQPYLTLNYIIALEGIFPQRA